MKTIPPAEASGKLKEVYSASSGPSAIALRTPPESSAMIS
jgi:hypothetical protein